MIRITVEIEIRKLELLTRRAPKVLREELRDAMERISKGFLKRFRAWRLQGPPGVRGKSGRGLFGTFKRTFFITQEIEGLGFRVFSQSRVAQQHEYGGLVRDPGGGRLAVPLSKRQDMFIRGKLKRRFKHPGRLKNIVPIRFKGQTYLTEKKKGTGEIIPRYVLKESVWLDQRLEFYKTWDRLGDYRIDRLNIALDRALKRI